VGIINTFPRENNGENKAKLDSFKHLVISSECDLLVLSEHNTNLLKTRGRDRPDNVMKNWWQNTISRFEWLKSTSESMFEQGGTAIVTHSRSSAHTIASGGDSRKMGRWNWVTLRGKDQIMTTTIISIYRPRAGQATSHRQLGRLQGKMDGDIREIQPQQMWKKDLAEFIREKKTARHEVIVAGDFNDDLNDERGTIQQFMAELGLRNLIKETNGPGPNTYSRGKTSVDGAYGMPRIKLKQGGYSSFDKSSSNHRFFYLDITENDLVGIGREDRPPPMLRKATSKIPSVKRQFNELLETEVKRHKLKEKNGGDF